MPLLLVLNIAAFVALAAKIEDPFPLKMACIMLAVTNASYLLGWIEANTVEKTDGKEP